MKTLRYILITALCFVLIVSMCSCSFLDSLTDRFFGKKDTEEEEEEKIVITDANSLFKAIESQMQQATQFQIEGNIEASITVMDQTIALEGSTKFITTNPNSDDPYYYSKNKVSATVAEQTQKQTVVLAYYNGKAYMSNTQHDSYIYSRMAKEDFLQLMEKDQETALDVMAASNQEYKQNDNGTWKLELSGYSKKALKKMIAALDPDGTFSEYFEITDIEWTIEADSQFRAQKIEINFVPDEEKSEETDKLTICYDNAKYEGVTPIIEDLTDGDYQKVADMKILQTLKDHLTDLKNSDNGAFTLNSKTTATAGKNQSASQEIDEVRFGKKNGAYFYSIQTTTNNRTLRLSYENGTRTTIGAGAPIEESFTDEESKSFIDSLLDNGVHFDIYRISDVSVEETEDGTVYTLSSVSPSETMKSTFEYCAEYLQEITVTVSDGKITKIVNKETAEGIVQSVGLKVILLNTITFP